MSDLDRIDINKKELLEMLKFFKGIVSSACEAVGICRATYYNYLSNDQDFASKVDEINEASIDHVESKLMEKINGISIAQETAAGLKIYEQPPSDTAIIFYLKTKGKKRGYVERQEIDLKGNLALSDEPVTFE